MSRRINMRTRVKNENVIETVTKRITEIPDDLTLAEMTYIRGIFDGMNAFKTMHKDAPEKTA